MTAGKALLESMECISSFNIHFSPVLRPQGLGLILESRGFKDKEQWPWPS